MAHYYAFCEVHKKCGPDRNFTRASQAKAKKLAWQDVSAHKKNKPGYHGEVYIMLSNKVKKNGQRRYIYTAFKD